MEHLFLRKKLQLTEGTHWWLLKKQTRKTEINTCVCIFIHLLSSEYPAVMNRDKSSFTPMSQHIPRVQQSGTVPRITPKEASFTNVCTLLMWGSKTLLDSVLVRDFWFISGAVSLESGATYLLTVVSVCACIYMCVSTIVALLGCSHLQIFSDFKNFTKF